MTRHAMSEGLQIHVLRKALDEVNALLRETSIKLIEKDLEVMDLSSALVLTSAFDEWLMDQDLSCAHQRKPSDDVKRVKVEGKDDMQLALAYARRDM
jgi:hypothetical protein